MALIDQYTMWVAAVRGEIAEDPADLGAGIAATLNDYVDAAELRDAIGHLDHILETAPHETQGVLETVIIKASKQVRATIVYQLLTGDPGYGYFEEQLEPYGVILREE